ncbi:MAG TPA: rhomboid family intramembrane serine protease [Candidatus Limnocylindrales bacterium]|nr:rhomboid family intramembrane serine protease [Candidatus Limnocylindrales bacterium]
MIPLRDANPTRRTPVVTLGLIAACAVVFAVQLGIMATGGDAALGSFVTRWGVVPAELVAALSSGALISQETATLITSQFLHGSLLHIGGNMLYLWIFGNNIEDRFGSLRFLVFYLVGGVVAALAQVAIAPTSTIPTIGASGAIAATLGAYLVLFPRARVTTAIFLVFFFQLIDIPAALVLGFWFFLQLLDGLGSLGVSNSTEVGGVAFFAHIGGFIFGAGIALLMRLARGGGRPPPRAVG